MGNHGFLAYVKARAREEAKLNAGRSTFMQTRGDVASQLETVQHVRGSATKKVVIADLVPLLFERHRATNGPADAPWLSQSKPEEVYRSLDAADADWVSKRREAFKKVLGNETLFIYVVDGKERPAAKEEELKKRQRRSKERKKTQRPMPSGLKKEDITSSVDGLRPWMVSKDENVIFLEAPHESDWTIGHVLTQSHSPPLYPKPVNAAYEREDISRVVELLKGFDPLDRITDTRDSDDPAILTANERGWCLLTGWHGRLDAIDLVDSLPHAPAATNQPASSKGAHGLPGRLRLPPTRTRAAAPNRLCSIASLDRLPTESGNSILFDGRGLDALPGIGSTREERLRTWALTGNDYSRSSPAGITRTVIASGLAEKLFEGEWTVEILDDSVTSLQKRLSSPDQVDVDWRGTGRNGRVDKTNTPTASRELIERVFQAYVIARGDQVPCIDRIVVTQLGPEDDVDNSKLPPRLSRTRNDGRRGQSAQEAQHAYRGRPSGQTSSPNAVGPTSARNPRGQNPLQARPRHVGIERPPPNHWRFRPRAPGPSVAMACEQLEPEFVKPTPEEFQREQARQAAWRKENAEREAKRSDIVKERERERKEREAAGYDDDKAELRDEVEKKPGLESVYQVGSSHEIAVKASMRYVSAVPVVPPSSTATAVTAVPPGSTSAARASASTTSATALSSNTAALSTNDGNAAAAASSSIPTVSPQGSAEADGANNAKRKKWKKKKNHSGARQRAARRHRLTSERPPDTTSKRTTPLGPPPPPAERLPTPEHLASLYTMSQAWVMAGHLALRFGHLALLHLLTGRLERGEAGMQAIGVELIKRNGLARLAGALAMEAGGKLPPRKAGGKHRMTEEEEAAIQAARSAGAVPPPRAAISTYTQLFISYQTAVSALPEDSLVADLRRLGGTIGHNPVAASSFALQNVFRSQHNSNVFPPTCSALLDMQRVIPDACSRLATALSKVCADVLADTTFTFESARAGTADVEDSGVNATTARRSSRPSAKRNTTASNQLRAGLVGRRRDDGEESSADSVKAALEEDFKLPGDAAKRLRAALKAYLDKMRTEAKKPNGPAAPAPSALDDLESCFRRLLFRLVAFRDRAIEIAINICEAPKPEACQGKTLKALIGGGAPINIRAFRKGLIGLVMLVRRMRGLADEELLPKYDAKWIPTAVVELVRMSDPYYLVPFVSDLEILVTDMARHVLPRLGHVDDGQAEILAGVRDLFDVFGADGRRWSWREAEMVGSRAGVDTNALTSATSVTLRLRPDLLRQAEQLVPTLRQVFGVTPSTSMARWITEHHAKAEVTNLLCRHELAPKNFVPTGFMQLSSTRVIFLGVKTDRADAEVIKKHPNLDAGKLWSEVSQEHFSQMTLEDYANELHPAYEWRRSSGNDWSSSEIEPIALIGAEAMRAKRDDATVAAAAGPSSCAPPPAPPAPPPPAPPPPTWSAATTMSSSPATSSGPAAPPTAAASRPGATATTAGAPASPGRKGPVYSKTRMKERQPQERTRDGLPVEWGGISKPAVARELDEHVRDVSPEDRNWIGVDIGQVQPISAYISRGTAVAGFEDGRAEAVATFGCGSSTDLQQRYNRATSHLSNSLSAQIDLDRFPLYDPPPPPPPPAPPPPASAPQAASTASPATSASTTTSIATASASSASPAPPARAPHSAPPLRPTHTQPAPPAPPVQPPPPTHPYLAGIPAAHAPSSTSASRPLLATWLHVLRLVHPATVETRRSFKEKRKSLMQSAAAEFVKVVEGGEERRTEQELGRECWTFFVGEESAPSSGDHGPSPANRLMRQIGVEMRARQRRALFVRVPEHGTSKHCGHPWCTDEKGKRSMAEMVQRKDGSTVFRLLRCVRCSDTFHRDGAAAANMVAQGMCMWENGVALWGESPTL